MKKNIFKKLAAVVAAVTTVVAMGTTAFAANTYNVAGAAGLCGEDWNPAGNQMTDNGDGTWTKEFTNVAAGTYEFKVVENGAWGNPDYNLEGSANSTGNASVTVAEDGSTVVVGFDGTKATVEVKAKEQPSSEQPSSEQPSSEEATSGGNGGDVPPTGDSSAVVLMLAVAAVAAGAVVVSRKRAVNE